MSVVHIIDTLTEWARLNVCEKVKLKVPPQNEDANDAGYSYEEANPTAFAMYVPTEEKLPPNIHSAFPSLCVRFLTGEEDLSAGSGHVDVQFALSAWDPGLHGQDVFIPKGVNAFTRQGPEFTEYQRNIDGWRDVWNFADTALRAVESVTHINGYAIDRSTPVQYGPFTERDPMEDYPFWFAWISFRVTYPLMRNINDLHQYL